MENRITPTKGEFELSNEDLENDSHFYPRPATKGMLQSDINYMANPGNTHIKLSIKGTPHASLSIISQGEAGAGFAVTTDNQRGYKGYVKITKGLGIRFQLKTHEGEKELETPINMKIQYEFLDYS